MLWPMQTYRYSDASRAACGMDLPGPWQDEPYDKIVWVDEASDLDCMVKRGPMGVWCGYVGVPPGHPAHGMDYDDVRLADDQWPDVHGGLTYAAPCADSEEPEAICHVPEPGRPEHVWWFGFDCGHWQDITPVTQRYLDEAGRTLPLRGSYEPTYKSVDYAKAETLSLAQQLAAMAA